MPYPNQAARNLYAAVGEDGVAYVTTYDPTFTAFYGQLAGQYSPGWVSLVERNMREGWSAQPPVKEWTSLFRRARFGGISVVPLLSRHSPTRAFQALDLGWCDAQTVLVASAVRPHLIAEVRQAA